MESLKRLFKYQISKTFNPHPFIFEFTDKSWLMVDKKMTGATGNLYCGLHEFEDMSFLLHFLRPEDLFIDIGANIGSYTVLASAHAGCQTISVEPIPSTYKRLEKNIQINHIEEKVVLLNIGLGAEPGVLPFTSELDTGNHVVTNGNDTKAIEVPISTLDEVLDGKSPVLIKMDVEGYEYKVLEGAKKTLQSASLKAVITEEGAPEQIYGKSFDSMEVVMAQYGFKPFAYDPWNRTLIPGKSKTSNNSLFIKDIDWAKKRVKSAPKFKVLNIEI